MLSMKMKHVVWGVVVGLAGTLFADQSLVRNGGFEETKDGRTVGWNDVGRHYAYVDGMGRSGTRALAFVNDDPQFYSFPGQKIDLKPGKAYRFEVWVRTENLTGPESGASLCIEWSDANGKWLGGGYADGVKGTTTDWKKIECVTPPIPADAKSFRIHPYVRKGMCGKAWFDDVSVTPYFRKPVDGLFCGAYRDVAAEGVVTFKAALNLDAGEHPLNQMAATVSWTDATGTVRTSSVDALTLKDAVWSHDVKDMKPGAQTVTFTLARVNGTQIGSASRTFTRADRLPARPVTFDRLGRTIVNGQPFFPLGMYWSSVSDVKKLDTYAQGPFNCLMPYGAPNQEGLDRCHAKGLKVIYSVKDIFSGTHWAPPGIKTEADEIAYIKDRVAKYKNHPAVLAWYLNDEMPLSMLPRLTARRDLLERLDPGHPGWVVLYQYSQIRDYLATFDVIGTDPYPIPSSPASMATKWTRATRSGTMGLKPLWQVPQAFDWAAYRKTPEEKAKCRAPTPTELRSMTWQCIAAGANGLVYYSYFDLYKEPNGVPFAKRWKEVCDVAAEVKAQIPVLLADGPAPTVADAPDALGVRTWGTKDAAYLLAVNTTDKPLAATLKLSERFGSATPVFGPASALAGMDISLSLAPLEPVFLRLAK